MLYQIKTINSREEILTCNRAEIDNYVWTEKNVYIPKSYAYLGFIPNEGLYLKMICEESNPYTVVTAYHERTCTDSCMECFLAFPEENEKLSTDVLYMNFEVNSIGNAFIKAAKGRKGRQFVSDEVVEKCNIKATVNEDNWSIELLMPIDFLESFSQVPKLQKGAKFYVNFYKVSETPEYEHYGSFNRIDLPNPNFHCPEFFADAEIV